jgi:hypothetical protein
MGVIDLDERLLPGQVFFCLMWVLMHETLGSVVVLFYAGGVRPAPEWLLRQGRDGPDGLVLPTPFPYSNHGQNRLPSGAKIRH